MIFVLKQGNYIYLTNKKRNLDSSNYQESELLMTLGWSSHDISVLEDCLRPWISFSGDVVRYKYCREVMEVIESHPKVPTKLYYAYKQDIQEVVSEVEECIEMLKKFEILDRTTEFRIDLEWLQSQVVYKCDILNFIYQTLPENVVDYVEKFLSLKKNEKDLVLEFYNKSSKQEKLEHLRNLVLVDIDRVLPFIPQWYKVNLRLFGIDVQPGFDRFKFSESPEYKDDERLDGNSVVLDNQDFYIRREVYKIFNIDEVWKGKDIKAKFGEIYEKLQTPKSSRVHDIFNYFETAITRNGYRLLSRKVI